MKVHLALVCENNKAFLNQVKLLLFSFRKNAGKLKDIPVTLVINEKPLNDEQNNFLKKHFSPIEIKTMPKLGGTPHTSKINALNCVDPSEYDVLMFMDCDTVVLKPLDNIIDPIKNEKVEFLCRRGGETDRNTFLNFESLVYKYCGKDKRKNIIFENKKEFSMFNSGVFLATSETVKKIKDLWLEISYDLYDHWVKRRKIEKRFLFKKLLKLGILKSKKNVKCLNWPLEQGALALSCINKGIKVKYLDEKYNSWGNLEDLKILHCFKSAYQFDRRNMFSLESEQLISEYEKDELPGKKLLAKTIKEYKKEHNDFEIKPKPYDRYYDYMYVKTKHIYGKININYGKNEAIVLCLVRDGETWIKDFIEHYQKLGFKHIVFLDNGSKDKTIEIAKKYKNITIFKTSVPFRGNNIFLRRCLAIRFGKDKWSLNVDIDELWDYPYSDKIPLSKFLEYLNHQGAKVVVAQMLDMFKEKIPEKRLPLASYNLYEVSNLDKLSLKDLITHGFKYHKILNDEIPFFKGGIRKTLFEAGGIWLTKMPLIFNDSELRPIRHQHFSNWGVISDISTVLLHYKFTENFKEKVDNALEEKQYCGGSVDYEKYAEVMYKDSKVNFKTKNSKKLENINQLIDDGVIVVTKKYNKWVRDNTQ